jgi:hypothetical protein
LSMSSSASAALERKMKRRELITIAGVVPA